MKNLETEYKADRAKGKTKPSELHGEKKIKGKAALL